MFNPEYRRILRSRRGLDCELLAQLAGPDSTEVARRHEFAHHAAGSDHWDVFAPIVLPTTMRRRERARGPKTQEDVRLTESPAPA